MGSDWLFTNSISLTRAENDLSRLREVKGEMAERVGELERNKSDQSDLISR